MILSPGLAMLEAQCQQSKCTVSSLAVPQSEELPKARVLSSWPLLLYEKKKYCDGYDRQFSPRASNRRFEYILLSRGASDETGKVQGTDATNVIVARKLSPTILCSLEEGKQG